VRILDLSDDRRTSVPFDSTMIVNPTPRSIVRSPILLAAAFAAMLVAPTAAAVAASPPTSPPPPSGSTTDAGTPTPAPAGTFQVGTRITWQGGESSTEGAQFVPDPNGWIWRDNQWYRVDSTGGNGGVGLQQVTLVSVAPDAIVGDVRFFLNTDLQSNTHVPSGYGVVTGTGDEVPGYWISPARLATMQEGFDGTTRVWRGTRTFLGQAFDTVTTAHLADGNYLSNTYDLESGLLLFGGSVIAAPGVLVNDQNGNLVGSADGSVRYQHSMLAGIRQTPVPWADAPLPSWASAGASLTYQGQTTAGASSAGLPAVGSQSLTVTEQLDQTAGSVVFGREVVQSSNGAGLPPSESMSPRVFSSALLDGLWIPADQLTQLQPGQVLDQDPATGRTVTFGGSDGTTATIVSAGPTDRVEQRYDVRTGVLVASRSEVSTAIGLQTTELTLASQS
jgi:hypothetical protein